ncbi:MAG: MATE family efflux transporter, partial [Betaproteobacteria bacterium HGW-Betaproteobacteria-15]
MTIADENRPGTHLRAILALGLPLIGSHLAQFSIHLTDTLMLGWYDVEALAASVLAVALFFVLFLVGSGFAWAVMPLVASAAAQGDTAQMRRVARMGIWLSAAAGVVSLAPLLLAEPLFRLAGQDARLSALAADYLAIA